MDSKKQKQKVNHVVIVTSEATDASVKQYRIKPWLLWMVVIVICVVIGAGLGYIIYEEQIWDFVRVYQRNDKKSVLRIK